MAKFRLALATAAVIAASAAVPGSAQVDSSWSEVARDESDGCALVVTGEGRFFRIAASGLAPGELTRYVLTNGDMRPIDWDVRADLSGRFARYYLPFRWHRSGGVVDVTLASESCTLSASFVWERAEVVVH